MTANTTSVLPPEALHDEATPRRDAPVWVEGLRRLVVDAGAGWLLPIGLLAGWEAAARTGPNVG